MSLLSASSPHACTGISASLPNLYPFPPIHSQTVQCVHSILCLRTELPNLGTQRSCVNQVTDPDLVATTRGLMRGQCEGSGPCTWHPCTVETATSWSIASSCLLDTNRLSTRDGWARGNGVTCVMCARRDPCCMYSGEKCAGISEKEKKTWSVQKR